MRVVVIGGGYAGVACAVRLAHRAREAGRQVHITLINERPHFVERVRLHQAAAGQALRVRSLAPLLERCSVRLVVGRAEQPDLAAQTVRVGGETLPWDRLVLALGSTPGTLQVPGAAEHTHRLQPSHTPALAARLGTLARTGGRIAVVGGGLTGIEAAAEIAETYPGLEVTLLARSPVAQGWSRRLGRTCWRASRAWGVRLNEGVAVEAVDRDHLHTDAGAIPFDACIWAVGFELPALPQDARLAVTAAGQVRVDPFLRALSHPHVYATGDIAAPAPDACHPTPMGCKSALPAGAHVAENLARELAGKAPRPFDFAVRFFCVSLGRHDGLIQWPAADGTLTGRVLTGSPGARFKELVCRSTYWSLQWEARGRPGMIWERAGRALHKLMALDAAATVK